jgi:hypothetical protein
MLELIPVGSKLYPFLVLPPLVGDDPFLDLLDIVILGDIILGVFL